MSGLLLAGHCWPDDQTGGRPENMSLSSCEQGQINNKETFNKKDFFFAIFFSIRYFPSGNILGKVNPRSSS